MVEDREVPVSWNGQSFCAVRRLGFDEAGHFTAAFWTTPPAARRGSYTSGIAVSPKAHRLDPSQQYEPPDFHKRWGYCRARFADLGHYVTIWDDWGHPTHIGGPRDILDTLLAECRDQAIPPAEPFDAPMPPRDDLGSASDEAQPKDGE